MNLYDFLTAIAGKPGRDLTGFLDRVAIVAPDFAPEIQALQAMFEMDILPEHLAQLPGAVKQELTDFLHGKVDPQDPPSDAV